MVSGPLYVELDYAQCRKDGEHTCGDAFASRKLPEEDRVIAVLSDGLGSGVKASILSAMTATMALRFVAANFDILRASSVMMDALPVCQVRKISYATFTIIDSVLDGKTRVVEQGNPGYFIFRKGALFEPPKREAASPGWKDRTLSFSEFETEPEDRIVVVSDGVSQAGLGSDRLKLGWRRQGCASFVINRLAYDPYISARHLSQEVVEEARRQEPGCLAKDDITCAVFYFRKPRQLMVLSGPPFDPSHDDECAWRIADFPGRKAICGGTTANIVMRELRRKASTPLECIGGLPPPSRMDGIDLVTEGILTLTRAAQYLEHGLPPDARDAAAQLAELLLESDQIQFVVGTRINEAHQDPTLPVDLEIRRNIIKRLAAALRERYLKEVELEYV